MTGNLGEPRLGLLDDKPSGLDAAVNIAMHSGAQVHWVLLYPSAKPANVQGAAQWTSAPATGKRSECQRT